MPTICQEMSRQEVQLLRWSIVSARKILRNLWRELKLFWLFLRRLWLQRAVMGKGSRIYCRLIVSFWVESMPTRKVSCFSSPFAKDTPKCLLWLLKGSGNVFNMKMERSLNIKSWLTMLLKINKWCFLPSPAKMLKPTRNTRSPTVHSGKTIKVRKLLRLLTSFLLLSAMARNSLFLSMPKWCLHWKKSWLSIQKKSKPISSTNSLPSKFQALS